MIRPHFFMETSSTDLRILAPKTANFVPMARRRFPKMLQLGAMSALSAIGTKEEDPCAVL
jgi:hypothetical protein